MGLPREFVVRESSHRIHDPFTADKLATLGRALRPLLGTRMLDLACGSGEMLCTWAREHGVTGTGVDISTAFVAAAWARAVELGVAERVGFGHGDASDFVAGEPVDIAGRVGPPGSAEVSPAPSTYCGEEQFGELGCDVVEMVLADQDSWDRYVAAQWLNIRRWLDENPADELAGQMRGELRTAPVRLCQIPARVPRLGCLRPDEPLTHRGFRRFGPACPGYKRLRFDTASEGPRTPAETAMTTHLDPSLQRSLLIVTRTRPRQAPSVLVLAVSGELDIDSCPAFLLSAASALHTDRAATAVVVDLAGLTFFSARGLRAVQQVCERARSRELRVAVVSGNRRVVRHVLAIGEIEKVADVFRTRREAVAALDSARPSTAPETTLATASSGR